jgi:hypothetical protein
MGYDDAVDARGAYDAMATAYVADESNAYNSLWSRRVGASCSRRTIRI